MTNVTQTIEIRLKRLSVTSNGVIAQALTTVTHRRPALRMVKPGLNVFSRHILHRHIANMLDKGLNRIPSPVFGPVIFGADLLDNIQATGKGNGVHYSFKLS